LRLAFVLLGIALLAPLAALACAAESRIEAQRRLRRDVVAERVFDELEREITLMLDRESQRPTYTLASNTDPATWAPFVVGYFVHDDRVRVSAEDELPQEQRARVRWAVAEREKRAPKPATTTEAVAAGESPTVAPEAPKALPPQQTTSPEILRQLNRAQEQKRQAPAPRSRSLDPFTDYQDYY
jgi:hypothetical protein